jgi:hypothetical protein
MRAKTVPTVNGVMRARANFAPESGVYVIVGWSE